MKTIELPLELPLYITDNLWDSPVTAIPSSAPSQTELPPELISSIVGNLWDDLTSLKHCSLVSRSWTAAAQRHLFRVLILGKDWMGHTLCVFARDGYFQPIPPFIQISSSLQTYHNFLDLVTRIPAVARNVRLVTFEFRSLPSSDGIAPYSQEEVKALSAILSKFTHVVAVNLILGNWTRGQFEHEEAISTIIQQPLISAITIYSTELTLLDLISLCTQSPGLKALNIEYLSPNSTASDVGVIGVDRLNPAGATTHLEDLCISGTSTSFIDWLLHPQCTVGLTYLRGLSLRVEIATYSEQHTTRLMRKTAPQLECLRLCGNIFTSQRNIRFYELNWSPNLRHLCLFGLESSETQSSAYNVVKMFSGLIGPLPLEELEMEIEIYFPQNLSAARLLWAHWRQVDSQLIQSELAHLRAVTITLSVHDLLKKHVTLEDCESSMMDVFSAFSAQQGRMLNVTADVYKSF
ncbi:hypothetical protein Hypma_003718 [Hypsizygus marmoreus]|uniref:F-box domain-containing protein n=1 Tax=Hypsizygus marmoreus TaxID=39966 RepID=A0A369J389_HYPMA|nr:hypothetical protein Hypma_003718 [Hypsizygus marmoreus]